MTRQSWLDPVEAEEALKGLLGFNLVKFDNNRTLPLKMGGTTDVYITLRDARNNPEALKFVSKMYEHPLRRLGVRRFAEVPDSVSCFAPLIATGIGMPYVTIRESPKEGRVSKASMIGKIEAGEHLALIDDVITDGESKIVPYGEIVAAKATATLLVYADRQQGWQKKFADKGVSLPVWPGTTLHEIRAYLVRNGLMRRCDPKMEEKNPIIIALDGKSWDEILPVIDPLRTSGTILKVNDLLMDKGMEWLLPALMVYGRVMADLKLHDIPNTIANVCNRLRRTPPWAVTVHASGSREMIQAAVKALEGTPTKVLAVTVLTSINEKTCEEIYSRQPLDQVLKFAEMAKAAGAHGLVCSPQEVRELKSRHPEFTLVTPGVRSPGEDQGDQARIDTPANAKEVGGDFFVMGRQLLGKEDPAAEVSRVMKDELKIA